MLILSMSSPIFEIMLIIVFWIKFRILKLSYTPLLHLALPYLSCLLSHLYYVSSCFQLSNILFLASQN